MCLYDRTLDLTLNQTRVDRASDIVGASDSYDADLAGLGVHFYLDRLGHIAVRQVRYRLARLGVWRLGRRRDVLIRRDRRAVFVIPLAECRSNGALDRFAAHERHARSRELPASSVTAVSEDNHLNPLDGHLERAGSHLGHDRMRTLPDVGAGLTHDDALDRFSAVKFDSRPGAFRAPKLKPTFLSAAANPMPRTSLSFATLRPALDRAAFFIPPERLRRPLHDLRKTHRTAGSGVWVDKRLPSRSTFL